MAKTRREQILAWALQSESAPRIRAMLDLARHLPPVYVNGYGWNDVRHKLACANAVVNLKTGVAEKGDPADKISLGTDVAYDDVAPAPRWRQFIEEIFPDPALRACVHRAVGYSATGETSEQCFFLCYGTGANGKTTFLSAIRTALGELAYTLPFAILEPTRYRAGENASPYLADLEGRRFVVASEVNENTRLDEARIKELTGEGVLTARRLHRPPFTYRPQLKLWLAVNHKPKIADDSDAFWRRVRFFPFTRKFEGDAIDAFLERTLAAECAGILRWIAEGAALWYADCDENDGHPALAEVPGSAEVVRDWRGESDPIEEFISSWCEIIAGARQEKTTTWEGYREWANAQSLPAKERLTRHSFMRRMALRHPITRSGNAKYFSGIRLIREPGPAEF